MSPLKLFRDPFVHSCDVVGASGARLLESVCAEIRRGVGFDGFAEELDGNVELLRS